MNLETLRQIIASIREIEPGRRLVIFGSSSISLNGPMTYSSRLLASLS